jgi:hypothetical protein
MKSVYLDTARLLTQVAPLVFVDDTFALKGGTAINLFVRDMPRLSVDLDLVFPDHTLPRKEALGKINAAIRQSAERLEKQGFQVHIPKADAGKLVAAMDRQHPRDLFDVMQLFDHEGITPGIRRAFLVYLASNNRPVHEVLFPQFRDIQHDHTHNFDGMTAEPVSLGDLLATRERLARELQQGLDDNERRFLLSLVSAEPEWPLLGIDHLDQLPAIRWKLQNLAKLKKHNPKKFAEQAEALAERLDAID